MQDPPRDRRTRKRELSRDLVYSAAVKLFVAQSFDDTTMDEIADRADVARATVFNHFPKKTAFLDEWTMHRRRHYMEALHSTDISDWPLDQVLQRYMREVARLCNDTRQETIALLGATLHQTNVLSHPQLGSELAQLIDDAISAGKVPAGINSGQAGLMIATSYFAILAQWIEADPQPFDLEEALLDMLNIALYGIYAAPRATNNSSSQVSAVTDD